MKSPLISVSALIRSSWDRFLTNWKLHLEISVRFFLAMTLNVIALYAFLNSKTTTYTELIIGIILLIASFLVSTHTTIGAFDAIFKGETEKAPSTVSNAIGYKLFLPYLLVSILVFCAVIGGATLLVLPGIWLAVRLMFAPYVVIEEGKTGMDALTRSADLVDGRWWSLLWRLIASSVVFVLIMTLCGTIIFALITLLSGRALVINPQNPSIYETLFSNLINAYFIPLLFISMAKLYTSAKETV